jgi:hypothetical protein
MWHHPNRRTFKYITLGCTSMKCQYTVRLDVWHSFASSQASIGQAGLPIDARSENESACFDNW